MSAPHAERQNRHLEIAARSILSPTESGRTENQDNYLIIDSQGGVRFLAAEQDAGRRLDGWPQGHVRLAVLDGLGGHSHGREAAEQSVMGLLDIPAQTTGEGLAQALEALHQKLHRQMHRRGEEPGCTLTLLEIPPCGTALLFHLGDSRLYAVGRERAECLTVDHVPMTKLAMQGYLGEAEWFERVHAQSGYQISQAFVLGNTFSDPSFYADALDPGLFELHDGNLPDFLKGYGDRRPLALQADRVYLLASDGLWHLAEPLAFVERWPEILLRPEQPLEIGLNKLFAELVLRARQESGLHGDNCTVVAFRLRG